MQFERILLFFTIFISSVFGLADQGDGGGAKTSEQTIVWITTTISGQLTTVSVLYTQSFMSTYSEAQTEGISSGNVGLGSISGSIGSHRSYDQTTISSKGDAINEFMRSYNVYGGLLGGIVLILGLI
ncbi:uncharacterized protein KGF55_003866 [Candida pseudojiufengensis]|uniref:uncharacterized protein n=1 Tax=Candida pseudojiufengensis TaxID=497109 RepID=UPI0022244A8D|nr:uncharacterized protein KGF55_003866 [Candida pseudojiufengensis]KAI5961895.1 hypothetical protein KGF55_003866 [Candida pseudojiufengensis]